MDKLAEAMNLFGQALTEIGGAISDALIETQSIVETPDLSIKEGFAFIEQETNEANYINLAILNLIDDFDTIIKQLHERHIQGRKTLWQLIGKYSNKSHITKEKAEAMTNKNLSNLNLNWNIGKDNVIWAYYRDVKFFLNDQAGYGQVDLHFSGELYSNYDTIYIDALNTLGKGIIWVHSNAPHYDSLVDKYGAEIFALTLKEVGISETNIDEWLTNYFLSTI